jgi:hypothetical protein
MGSSKTLALMFLLGALLVGGALGFTADRVIARDSLCAHPGDRVAMLKRLSDELRLSASQRTAIENILDKRHRDLVAILAPVRPQMDSVRGAARAEIAKLLTDRQRPAFQRMIEDSKKQEEASRK